MAGTTGGEATVRLSREAQDHVQEKLIAGYLHEAEQLPTERQKQALYGLGSAIVPSLLSAHSVLYRMGLHERLDLDQPLPQFCQAGSDLLAAEGAQGDETLRASQLTYVAVRDFLTTIRAADGDPAALVQAGIALGKADVRLTQVVRGLWGIMAAADVNASAADQIRKTRSSGGTRRGQSMKEAAAKWKADALPVAMKFAKNRPGWTRSRIATEILQHFDWEKPNHRQIEIWLQKEAEAPNGPLPSRSRKRGA